MEEDILNYSPTVMFRGTSGLIILYSESQINEYIARAHKMSSSKFILKCRTAVMLPHWSAQKRKLLRCSQLQRVEYDL